MSPSRILGHLAQRFAVSEENIATEALTWILRQSPAANRALSRLARSAGADLPDDLTYIGQVGTPETGRPDIVGSDESGRERLLLEAKFAAQLTDQQPEGYLKRLPVDLPCLLLVVAPSLRMSSLWVELLTAVPSLRASAPSPSVEPTKGLLSTKVGERHVLALASWRHLITDVVETLRSAGESALAQDAEQLLALTEVMDSAAYAPVRPGDYSPRDARQVHQLEVLIDDTYRAAIARPLLERFGTASHGRIFYGWYLVSVSTKKRIWFGFLPRAWDRHGQSPLWIQITISEYWSRQRVMEALAPLNRPGGPGLFEDSQYFIVPVPIPHFTSQGEAVRDLVGQVEYVTLLLDAAVPPNETPLPEEPVIPVKPDDDSSHANEPGL